MRRIRIHLYEAVTTFAVWTAVTLAAMALAVFSAPYMERPSESLAYYSLADALQSVGDPDCTRYAQDQSCAGERQGLLPAN